MVARLTPDQKVACSNHVGVTNFFFPSLSHFSLVSNHSFVSVFIFIFFGLVTFHPLLTKLSFAGCYSSTFQICPVRNLPAALPPHFSCFEMQPVSSAIFRLCHSHVRKDTRLSPHFCTESNGKLGGAWERDYAHILYAYPSLHGFLTPILPYMLSNCISRLPDYRAL